MTSLAVTAAKKALEMAEVDPLDVDLVILCTSTPDDIFGSACLVWTLQFWPFFLPFFNFISHLSFILF